MIDRSGFTRVWFNAILRLPRPRHLHPLVFVDIETTGLDPQRHDIIEVTALHVDPMDYLVDGVFSCSVAPSPDRDVDIRVPGINGFNSQEWAVAPKLAEVLPKLAEYLDGAIVAGHNTAFDWAFIHAAYRRLGLQAPSVGHHLLDTASLAWPLLRHGLVSSLSLRELCDHYGISNAGAHGSMVDAVRTYKVFLRLVGASTRGNIDCRPDEDADAIEGGVQ